MPSTVQQLLDEAAASCSRPTKPCATETWASTGNLVEEAAQLIEEARQIGGDDVEASIAGLLARSG